LFVDQVTVFRVLINWRRGYAKSRVLIGGECVLLMCEESCRLIFPYQVCETDIPV